MSIAKSNSTALGADTCSLSFEISNIILWVTDFSTVWIPALAFVLVSSGVGTELYQTSRQADMSPACLPHLPDLSPKLPSTLRSLNGPKRKIRTNTTQRNHSASATECLFWLKKPGQIRLGWKLDVTWIVFTMHKTFICSTNINWVSSMYQALAKHWLIQQHSRTPYFNRTKTFLLIWSHQLK